MKVIKSANETSPRVELLDVTDKIKALTQPLNFIENFNRIENRNRSEIW